MKKPGRVREEVGREIRDRRLWEPTDTVGVAVSGGLDSVVLLDILFHTQKLHRGELRVVTVDHSQRADSGDDLLWVKGLAGDLGLPVESIKLDAPLAASESQMRTMRYAWFASLNMNRIALGHHLNDQAETVLFQLARGSGLSGFRGMRWKRSPYVRPMLGLQRTEILNYAEALDLTWREDESNQDPSYTRNRIRHELMPIFEDIRVGAQKGIARSAAHALDESDAFEQMAVDWLSEWESEFSIKVALSKPEAFVRKALLMKHSSLKSSQLDDIFRSMRRGHGTVRLDEKNVFLIKGGTLTLQRLV